ncbi:MAG: hypothetical protein ACXU95_14940, partial [Isosphaeraceae bacterium]
DFHHFLVPGLEDRRSMRDTVRDGIRGRAPWRGIIMRVATRARTFAASGLALAAVAAGVWLAFFRSSPEPLSLEHPIRVTLARGCPSAIAGFDGVSNPDSRGLDHILVPEKPMRGLICRFAPVLASGKGGAVSNSVQLAQGDARQLAHVLDQISPYHLSGPINCPSSPEQLFDVIVFGYAGKPDVDVWFAGTGCVYVENGFLVRMRITPRIVSQFDVFTGNLNRFMTQG